MSLLYRGYQYRTAAPAATIQDQYWRHHALRFWIYCVCESKTASDLPAPAKKLRAKQFDKLPQEVQEGLAGDADTQQRVFAAVERGMCWFMKMEGVGWDTAEKRGDKAVPLVHNVLWWIEQFRNRSTVNGSKLIWARVESQVK